MMEEMNTFLTKTYFEMMNEMTSYFEMRNEMNAFSEMNTFPRLINHPDRLPPLPYNRPRPTNCRASRPVLDGNIASCGSYRMAVLTWDVPRVPPRSIKYFEMYIYEVKPGRNTSTYWNRITGDRVLSFPNTVKVWLGGNERCYIIVSAQNVDGRWGPFSDAFRVDP